MNALGNAKLRVNYVGSSAIRVCLLRSLPSIRASVLGLIHPPTCVLRYNLTLWFALFP